MLLDLSRTHVIFDAGVDTDAVNRPLEILDSRCEDVLCWSEYSLCA